MQQGEIHIKLHYLYLKWHGGHLKEHLFRYHVNVLKICFKLRIIVRLTNKFINLEVEY